FGQLQAEHVGEGEDFQEVQEFLRLRLLYNLYNSSMGQNPMELFLEYHCYHLFLNPLGES
uniref:hypothetical protein n=1 Tax=Bacteroides congonensis TaxID=1871006 RepID=UPI002FDAABB7